MTAMGKVKLFRPYFKLDTTRQHFPTFSFLVTLTNLKIYYSHWSMENGDTLIFLNPQELHFYTLTFEYQWHIWFLNKGS